MKYFDNYICFNSLNEIYDNQTDKDKKFGDRFNNFILPYDIKKKTFPLYLYHNDNYNFGHTTYWKKISKEEFEEKLDKYILKLEKRIKQLKKKENML